MKILFVSTGHPIYDAYPYRMGGTQSQIYGMASKLVKLGHEIFVLRRFIGTGYETIEGIHFVEIPTHFNDEVFSRLIFSREAAEKIKEIRPDVINLSERFSAYFPSKLDTPKIFFTANYDAFRFYKEFAVGYNKLNYLFFDIKRGMEESIMGRSDAVIALNKSVEKYLHSIGITHTKIIPRGVDPKLYEDKGDEKYILYTGRLNRVKGVEYLIKAFDSLDRDFDEYRLIIIGQGPDEERLKKVASFTKKREKIKFVPWLEKPELRAYLSRCSIFVLPSLFETFGISTLEGMASGKAVITSNIMGPKDIITHNYDGFLFEKMNANELKRYIELCLSDANLRKSLGRNAKKTIKEKYSFDKVARDLLGVYDKIL